MTGICSKCGEPCQVVVIDFGVGLYEVGGASGVDIDERVVSNCCEAPAVDGWGFLIILRDLREEIGDD